MLNQASMLDQVRAQLALDLNCHPSDLLADGIVFCDARENPGRRPFPRGERHFEMLSMGRGVVVSASPDIMPYLREQLDGVNRDDAFSRPFVYGQGINSLPDLERLRVLPVPEGFALELYGRDRIPELYAYEGFHYAVSYDVHHPRPDVLAVVGRRDGVIAGIAGASEDCASMWQIGLNVLPEYRQHGLAAAMVSLLAQEIVSRGIIPYYAVATSNIASQRVALRSGLVPAWCGVYRGRFDGILTLPTS